MTFIEIDSENGQARRTATFAKVRGPVPSKNAHSPQRQANSGDAEV